LLLCIQIGTRVHQRQSDYSIATKNSLDDRALVLYNGQMRSRSWLAALALISLTCADEDHAPSARLKCVEVRDRLVDLRVAEVRLDVEGHRDAMKRALGESFVASCEQSMSASQVACILNARDRDDATACDTRDIE
jgi:hypothetical protein